MEACVLIDDLTENAISIIYLDATAASKKMNKVYDEHCEFFWKVHIAVGLV